MDPLIKIPIEQWPDIQSMLKDTWPLNVAGFYALKQNIEYPNVREAFKFQVYSPFGDARNGFVAISYKGDPDCIIFPTTMDTLKLEEALLKTKFIDWTKNLCIDLVTSQTLGILKNIFPTLKLSYCKIGTVKTYFYDRNKNPFDFELPAETYLAPLDQNHIRRVDDTWPYKHAASYFYFSTLAANGLAQGLYSKDHQLLAWVFVNEFHFLCHLYCDEKHRRKGYAKCVLKYTVNDQLAQGNDVYTYVEDSNESSSRLFDKLGFVNIDNGAYVFAKK